MTQRLLVGSTPQMQYALLTCALLRPIDKRERKLEQKGPVWRAPLVIDVLRNLPFLRHVPARAVEVRLPSLKQHGKPLG